jgi:hypothetical protein
MHDCPRLVRNNGPVLWRYNIMVRRWAANAEGSKLTMSYDEARGQLQLDHFGSQLNTANCSATRSPAAGASQRSIGSSSNTTAASAAARGVSRIRTCNELAAQLQRCLARSGTGPATQR